VDAAGVIGVFSYGGMPYDMATRNVQLFADKVLPRLKKLGSARAATATDGARVAA